MENTSLIDLSNFRVDIPTMTDFEYNEELKSLTEDLEYYETILKTMYDNYFQISMPNDKTL